MIRRILFLAVCCVSCSHEYSDFFPYHDDGTPKPSVALVPVINECQSGLPWDLSQELSKDIRLQIMKHGKLFLPSQQELQKGLASCSQKEMISSKDLMPFLYFQPAHFVVVLELVDFKKVPYKRGQIKPLYVANIDPDEACVVMMKMRLKIVDIRGGEPRLIRQEVIESNHMLRKDALTESIDVHSSDAFLTSPLGLAEARFVRDLVQDIERITSFERP